MKSSAQHFAFSGSASSAIRSSVGAFALVLACFFSADVHAWQKEYVRPKVPVGADKQKVRLDWCLHWARDCGKPAADAFCASAAGKGGTGKAVDWRKAENIGSRVPTYLLGDKKFCRQSYCDGFDYIRCEFEQEG